MAVAKDQGEEVDPTAPGFGEDKSEADAEVEVAAPVVDTSSSNGTGPGMEYEGHSVGATEKSNPAR